MLMASMWHAPSVLSCTAGMRSAAIFSASIWPVMSPSMTPMENEGRSFSMSAVSSVVLPAPGLPITFTRQTCCSCSVRRTWALTSSFHSMT